VGAGKTLVQAPLSRAGRACYLPTPRTNVSTVALADSGGAPSKAVADDDQ
jgi:hypothetical protein